MNLIIVYILNQLLIIIITYFSNRVIVDENIFYNFTKNVKKIKFVIKFQMVLSRVIKIWYIKNDNYRLVIKNYGLENIFSNIVYIMSDLENVYKLNRYFYMDSNQNILKYKKYCIISDFEKMLLLIIKI